MGTEAAYQAPRSHYALHDSMRTAAELSTTLVHALSDAMGVDVRECESSLYEAVDPGALDRLFRPVGDGSPRDSGHVAFLVSGYRVTVYYTGHIVIDPPLPPSG
jgi:hypothetical protein